MDWVNVAISYLSDAFLDSNKWNGFLAPSVTQGIVFTAVSFVLGWMVSLSGTHRRLKTRVINELILSQSELKARAWPAVWRRDGVREAWMLDPFLARIRFLNDNLAETKSLNRKQLDLIEAYTMRVEEFIEKWAETMNRTESYRDAYAQTYHMMRAATRALGLKENKRYGGLAPPSDELFNAPPPSAPAPVTPPEAPQGFSGGLVPAE